MIDQERIYKLAMIQILSDLLEDGNSYLHELIVDFESSYPDVSDLIKPEEC